MAIRRRRRRNRSYRPSKSLRGGAVIVALVAILFLAGDRSGLDRWLSGGFGNGGPGQQTSPSQTTGTDFSGRVTRIVDGDTFWISGQSVRIRIWGLDAPETGQPGGAAATAELSRLIAGEALHCRQRDIDRYGRIVGQCFLPDGRDITAAMIASGTAVEYCFFSGNHYRTC